MDQFFHFYYLNFKSTGIAEDLELTESGIGSILSFFHMAYGISKFFGAILSGELWSLFFFSNSYF